MWNTFNPGQWMFMMILISIIITVLRFKVWPGWARGFSIALILSMLVMSFIMYQHSKIHDNQPMQEDSKPRLLGGDTVEKI